MSHWNLKAHQLLDHHRTQTNEILRMIDTATAPSTEQDRRRQGLIGQRSPAGDEARLRGIPAIGRNVQGAIPGTSPHTLRNIRTTR